MAQKRLRISPQESAKIREAVDLLGSDTVRQIWRTEGKRLPSRERLANLETGTGKLTPSEKARLNQIVRNAPALSRLKERGEENTYTDSRNRVYSQQTKDRRIAHALKAWMLNGKEPGRDYRTQHPSVKKRQQKAIKALIYLGGEGMLHSDDPDYGT